MHKQPLVTIKDIVFKAPNCNKLIIDRVSFVAHPRDFIILLGSNGSGKSSLLNLINRTYAPNTGAIKFLDVPLKQYKNKNLAKKIVTLTQNTADNLFMDMTIAENGILSALRNKCLFDRQRKKHQLVKFKKYLAEFHPQLSKRIHTPVNKLSGGERQILTLALFLQHKPDLILLDEHTSALDPKTAKIIMEKTFQEINKRNITCIMATHNLDFALRYGNRLLALHNGKITNAAAGQQKTNFTKQDLLKSCYNCVA